MPDKILHKRSLTSGSVPTVGSLDVGELAINVADGKLYIRRSGSINDIVPLVTANTNTSGSITATDFTGSLFGTASYAIGALTASYAINVQQIDTGSLVTTSSFNSFTSSYTTGSFTGSFTGNGAGLTNIPASGITGLNLSQIASGSVSASVSPGTSSFVITSGSSTLLYVSSSGRVGIGTTTPAYNLDISGSARLTSTGNTRFRIDTTNISPNTGFGLTHNNVLKWSNATYLSSGTNLSYVIFNDQTTTDSLFIQGDTNNVGIGTTSPSFKLDINGTGRFSGNLTITGSASNSLLVRGSGTTNSTTALRIENSAASPSLIVLDNRNIGIGTASPGYNLDVNGTVRFTAASSTSATSSFIINNSSGSAILTMRDDGRFAINTSIGSDLRLNIGGNMQASYIYGSWIVSGQIGLDTGTAFTYGTNGITSYRNGNYTFTGGTNAFLTLNVPFAPTSGTGVYNVLNLSPTINQTGGANGITRGLYVNPTITSASNFIAIQTTTGSVIFNGDLTVTGSANISGSLTVQSNLTVLGTASFIYTTASIVEVGASTITLNTDDPVVRFGGIVVVDSGSFGNESTGSLLWDSERDHWIYARPSGSSYTSGMLISGPRHSGALGEEEGTTLNALTKGQGGDHITSSGIFEDASGNVSTSGSLTVLGGITGSFTGSLTGIATSASFATNTLLATSALTASFVLPLTQSVLISGSLSVTGSVNITGSAGAITVGRATSTVGLVHIQKSANSALANLYLATPYPSTTPTTILFQNNNFGGGDTGTGSINWSTDGTYFNISNRTVIGSGFTSIDLVPGSNMTLSRAGAGDLQLNFLQAGVASYVIRNVSGQKALAFITDGYTTTTAEAGRFTANSNFLVGTTSDIARVAVKGSGTTNATNALLVQNANASSSFIVDDAGNVGVGAVNTSYKFNVEGTSRFSSDVTITSPGRLYFTDTTNAYIRASNNRIWLAAFGSEVFVVDSAQNQSISSLRIGSFVNANTSNALTVALAKTAAGGSAASISVSNSLTAAANNDLLIGLDLNPTFSNAGFSNVSNIALRTTTGSVLFNGGFVNISGSASTSSAALLVYKSGSTVVDIQGSTGQLFSITDSLSGSLFSVNTVAGLPVLEAFSDNTVNIGKFGVYPIKVFATGTLASVTGSFTGSFVGSLVGSATSASFATSALTASFVLPLTQSLLVSGSANITGTTTVGNLRGSTDYSIVRSDNSAYIKFYNAPLIVDFVPAATRISSGRLESSVNGSFGVLGALSARLHVRGSGTTNATTALRVENSAGNASLQVLDSRDVHASTNLIVTGTLTAGQNTGTSYNHTIYAGLGSVNISRLDTYASSYTLGVGSGPYDMGNNNAQLYVYGPGGWGTNATLARFATSNIRSSTYMIDVGNGGSTTTIGSMARFHTIDPGSITIGGSATQSFAGLDIKFKGQTYNYSQPINTSISSILLNNELNTFGLGSYTAYLGVKDIDISSSYANFASPYTAIDIRPRFTGTPSGSNIHVGIDIRPTLGTGYNFIALRTSTGSVIFNSGSVGIGISNPNFTLDVSGSSEFIGNVLITGSLIAPSITGSLLGTASFALTASSLLGTVATSSFALTASYVDLAISSSFASTASYVNPLNQNVIISGSTNITFTENNNNTPRFIITNNGSGNSSTFQINAGGSGNPNIGFGVAGVARATIGYSVSNNSLGLGNLAYSAVDFMLFLNSNGSLQFKDPANSSAVRLQVLANGNTNIAGNLTVTGSANNSLLVRGTGTTSATNALLVQNSNASSSLVVRDDQTIFINDNKSYGSSTDSLVFTYPNVTNWIGNADKGILRVTSNGRIIMTDRYDTSYFNAGLHVNRLYTDVNIAAGFYSDVSKAGVIGTNTFATTNISFPSFNAGIGTGGGVINNNNTQAAGIVGVGRYSTDGYTAAQATNTYGGYFFSGTTTSLGAGTTKRWTGVEISVNPTLTSDTTSIGIGLNVNVAGTYTKYAALFNGGNVGIGTTTPSASLHVAGNTILSGSAGTSSALTVYKSGSTVMSIQGSQGELFSITDSLSGSLFSVSNISGLPILEVFSDNTILLGDYLAPALFTSEKLTISSGSTTIYNFPTSSYDGAFIDYTIKSGSNVRAGQLMATWAETSTVYTDNSTVDIGNTNAFVFGTRISGSNLVVTSSVTTSGWTLKAIIRSI